MKRIVITGTHITPALATIKAIRAQTDWEIHYIGRAKSLEGKDTPAIESQIIPQYNIPFHAIPAGRLQRKFTRWTIPSLLKIPPGVIKALLKLRQIKPNLACSFGGYVSVPVVLAAWLLEIPVLTHEQTTTIGLANKINALFSDKIAVAFPESRSHFPNWKTISVGNPIRPAVFKTKPAQKHFSSSRPRIYITGGNQGAQVINQAVGTVLDQLLEKYNVIHQCGPNNFSHWQKIYQQLNEKQQQHYYLVDYIDEQEIGWALHSNIVVGRSGANTVWELAALGTPAILIPIPWSAKNEQYRNAKFLARQGGAIILEEKDLSGPTLLAKINHIRQNENQYRQKTQQAAKKIPRNAARRLVEEMQELL